MPHPRPAASNSGADPAERAHTFRPDIEGLRAIAVLLVALDHAGISQLAGGYVGVDVFFVLSGFLITSLLLREASAGTTPSIIGFYARRARRILPAATLVIVATVIATYATLGFIRGGQVAVDAQWTSAFLGNVHFALTGVDYLGAQNLPSPLQHYWSLGVEEQFYIVWPWLLVGLASRWRGFRLRTALTIALVGIFVTSLGWSYLETNTNGTLAYFSPLTRAWELAAGALLAVGGPALGLLRPRLAAAASWAGVAGIIASALILDSGTPFPGVAALLPVASTALVVVGGGVPGPRNARALLELPPFQWLGRLSYSFYLWHWPLLVIPAQMAGSQLPLPVNLALLGVAILLSGLTYVIVENPVRRSPYLARRPLLSISGGVTLVVASILFATFALIRHRIL